MCVISNIYVYAPVRVHARARARAPAMSEVHRMKAIVGFVR